MAKKQEQRRAATRARITGVAMELFGQRGFDGVTVAEIAAAADVSKVTVFNHFPHKEDLVLDRLPEAIRLVTAAVRSRSREVSPVGALERLAVELAEQRHVFSGLPPIDPFVELIRGSASVRNRGRELLEDLERELARILVEAGEPTSQAALLAAVVLAAYRSVSAASVAQIREGVDPEQVAQTHQLALRTVFNAIRTFEIQATLAADRPSPRDVR